MLEALSHAMLEMSEGRSCHFGEDGAGDRGRQRERVFVLDPEMRQVFSVGKQKRRTRFR